MLDRCAWFVRRRPCAADLDLLPFLLAFTGESSPAGDSSISSTSSSLDSSPLASPSSSSTPLEYSNRWRDRFPASRSITSLSSSLKRTRRRLFRPPSREDPARDDPSALASLADEDDPTVRPEDADGYAEDDPAPALALALAPAWGAPPARPWPRPRLPDALIVSTDATEAAVEGMPPPLGCFFFFLVCSCGISSSTMDSMLSTLLMMLPPFRRFRVFGLRNHPHQPPRRPSSSSSSSS
mmetsp:Transcript_6866/g.19219  ORF Transcript_6866/g.19219 Transcript_6866/m.19219 type:complete len:239 (-) Transcript_6866:681-1397(-)